MRFCVVPLAFALTRSLRAISLYIFVERIWAMEPLSALAVACAVIQFVDFGSKVVGTGLEVYKSADGAPEDVIEVEALASHAEQLSKKLASSRQIQILNTGARDEANLRELANRSEKLANEIVTILARIRGQPHHTWSAVRTAVQLKWNESKIKNLQARLDAVKSEIWLQLLCMMR
jgi:UDP-glucose 4-epimerase